MLRYRKQRGYLLAAAALIVAVGCQLLVDLDGLKDGHCGPNEKSCSQGCVPRDIAATGCAGFSCAPCALNHAFTTCGDNGQCVFDGCVPGWEDCNRDHSNLDNSDGCEVDLAHNPLNCGACFHECIKPTNGSPGCSEMNCVIGACNSGWEDCDHDPKTGCEEKIWTNEQCLTCKLPCAEGTTCDQGICH